VLNEIYFKRRSKWRELLLLLSSPPPRSAHSAQTFLIVQEIASQTFVNVQQDIASQATDLFSKEGVEAFNKCCILSNIEKTLSTMDNGVLSSPQWRNMLMDTVSPHPHIRPLLRIRDLIVHC
jgi:hypothetical protein